MPRLHFEDFPVGHVITQGPRLVTRQEIIAFAAEFDPQPFHLDEAAAAHTLIGTLCASGWHTCAILMRMMYDSFVHEADSHGAPGVEEVQWLRPLTPGTEVVMRGEVLEARVSKSRPQMGLVRLRFELADAAGAVILRQSHTQLIGRREAEAA